MFFFRLQEGLIMLEPTSEPRALLHLIMWINYALRNIWRRIWLFLSCKNQLRVYSRQEWLLQLFMSLLEPCMLPVLNKGGKCNLKPKESLKQHILKWRNEMQLSTIKATPLCKHHLFCSQHTADTSTSAS